MRQLVTLWHRGQLEWRHVVKASPGVGVPAQVTTWTTSRVVSLIPEEPPTGYLECCNDLDVTSFHQGLADLRSGQRFWISRFRRARRTLRKHCRRLSWLASTFGWVSVRECVEGILSDRAHRPAGPLSSRDLSVYWLGITDDLNLEREAGYEWKTIAGANSPRDLLESIVTMYAAGWMSLNATLRYLEDSPDHSVQIVYGWEPSAVLFLDAEGRVSTTLFVSLQRATEVAEFLALGGQLAPDLLGRLQVTERYQDAASKAYVVTIAGRATPEKTR